MTSHVFCSVCGDDDNAHVLLLKITRFPGSPHVGVMASLHSVVLASFVTQVNSVYGAGWRDSVCVMSTCRTIRTTATALMSGVHVADPTCWDT